MTPENLPHFTHMFIVRRYDGKYLALDQYSGGYPFWTHAVMQAERYAADDRILQSINSNTKSSDNPIAIHELIVGVGMSVEDFEAMISGSVRKQALAKLTPIEKKILGLE